MDIQTTLTVIEKLQQIQAFANGHYISIDHLNSMIGKLRIELEKDSDGMSCLGVQFKEVA
mgnify:CR=1 FL=1